MFDSLYVLLGAVLVIINMVLSLTVIFVERHETSVTLAWILVFLFLPYIGLLFYYLFGSTRKFKFISKQRDHFKAEKVYAALSRRQASSIADGSMVFTNPAAGHRRDMVLFNNRNASCCYSQDNQVELLISAEAKFKRMMEEIRKAKESIHVLYFIIMSRDEIAQELLNLLAQKAREGVEVRVIYDLFGDMKSRMHDYREVRAAGGIVYRFMPTLIRSALYVNYQLHRKMVIIDGTVAYTGGINVGDEYFGKNPKKTPWRDTSIRLTGSSVVALQIQFLQDFLMLDLYYRKGRRGKSPLLSEEKLHSLLKPPIETGDMGVQIVSSGPDTKYPCVKDGYLKMITSARRYCYIQSPYFIPDGPVMEALRVAAMSGVDVRIMLPGIPDKPYVYYITLSNIEQLLRANIKVYLHAGFIHAKMLVADDCVATVGTANMDIRSFILDYEVNAFVYDEGFAQDCRKTFERDMEDSRKLDLETYKKRGMWQKFCESVCRLISPLA